MSETDARKAIEEHTTSKLRAIDELDAIGTLGFRGEALHAIGSVSRMAIRTKPRGGSRGTELVVEGGDRLECGPVGCPEGTTVEVTDLFGNVPARRKYLKTAATEFDHVQSVVAGYALANPDVAITLTHDGRERFSTAGDGDRRNAALAVYGREVAASMIPVGAAREDADAVDGPLDGVEGLVSHPETNRAGREYATTLVDSRYATASVVREAVVDAYGDQLAPDRYPFAVVDIDVPPGGVDVNVHPRKLEVLFADDEGAREQVREAVRSALLAEGLVRSRAPRGRSAPEQTEIPDDASSGSAERPPETGAGRDAGDASGGTADATSRDTGNGGETGTDAGALDDAGETGPTGRATPSSAPPSEPADSPGDGATSEEADGTDGRTDAPGKPAFREAPTQRTLGGEATTGTPEDLERLPSMEVLGQYDDTYLVAETADGLLLVDQHAADERVNYERLRERFAGDVTTQALADPVELELTAREAALFERYRDALARLGFHANRVDDRTVEVTTVPALVAEAGDPSVVRDVLSDLVGGEGTAEGTVESIADDLLADMACYPSITGNTSLTDGSVVDLLSALDECENPWACPHGRPVLIQIDSDEIEDRFERDYPGH
jgi:DNA mismatch repair protein MutL